MQLPNNAVSVSEAARISGLNEKTLRNLLGRGTIKATKYRGAWCVDLDSLQAYVLGGHTKTLPEIKINGERAIRLVDFARERGIPVRTVQQLAQKGKIPATRLSYVYYITESDVWKYDNRFKFHGERAITSFAAAMERLKRTGAELQGLINNNYLEAVNVEQQRFIYTDTLERFEEQQEAGLDFLVIPTEPRPKRKYIKLPYIRDNALFRATYGALAEWEKTGCLDNAAQSNAEKYGVDAKEIACILRAAITKK